MKKIEKKIDLNAHIIDIHSSIVNRNGIFGASITFENVTKKTITAIKLYAVGYNSFDEVVMINGRDNFEILIQDIAIQSNQIGTVNTPIPDQSIRKLEVKELQVCYMDGSIDIHNEECRILEIEEYESIGLEGKVKNALEDKYGPRFIYKPKDFYDIWMCGCGRVNKMDSCTCSSCHFTKEEIFRNTLSGMESDFIKEVNDSKIQAEKRKFQRQLFGLCIFIGIVTIACVMFWLIKRDIDFSKRKIFTSEEKMQSELQGLWGCEREDSNYVGPYLEIKGNVGTRVLDENLSSEYDIIWNPSKGSFECGPYTYIVGKTGNFWMEGNEREKYKRKDYMTSNENGYEMLVIDNIKTSDDSQGSYYEGTITNNGIRTYTQVQIFVAFKDEFGKPIYTNIIPINEIIEPGQTIQFKEYPGFHIAFYTNRNGTFDISVYDFKYKQ